MTSGVKHTYKYVKEYIESYEYTLLSTEYLNDTTKLTIMCPHGHIYDVTFNSFKRGTRCKKCVGNEKHSQKYIENECIKRGYKLLNEYVNGKTKLILEDREGYLYSVTWDSFGQGCNPLRFSRFNLYTIRNIKLWIKTNAVGYELLSTEFKNAGKDKLLFRCPEGHEFPMSWHNLQQGNRCPICAGKQVTPENCVAVTDTWMIPYFKNKEDAYIHSHGSNDIIEVKCPHCGKEKKMTINKIYTRKSIGCNCGDGTSYPEKFVMSMLDQSKIEYTKEYSPLWSNKKRYDFYLPDYNCIIETHGEQHYKQSTRGRSLQEEQENDRYKKELALENGIDYYIVLDCRESNLKYIKNSILESELNNLFNLSQVYWLKCDEFAISNRVKEVCDYWHLHNEINNEELTTTNVAKTFKLNICTIIDYLRKGTKLKWCNYNSELEQKKASSKSGKLNGKPVEIFKDGKSLGVFFSCVELERQSEKLFGIKLLQGGISSVCRGEQNTHRGYTFKYISKEEYEKK